MTVQPALVCGENDVGASLAEERGIYERWNVIRVEAQRSIPTNPRSLRYDAVCVATNNVRGVTQSDSELLKVQKTERESVLPPGGSDANT